MQKELKCIKNIGNFLFKKIIERDVNMEILEIIDEIETGNYQIQDGLDYVMDCVVTVNKVRTRCEQISIVQCDMSKYGRGIETLLELRRGEFISWLFIEDIECLEVKEVVNGVVPTMF